LLLEESERKLRAIVDYAHGLELWAGVAESHSEDLATARPKAAAARSWFAGLAGV